MPGRENAAQSCACGAMLGRKFTRQHGVEQRWRMQPGAALYGAVELSRLTARRRRSVNYGVRRQAQISIAITRGTAEKICRVPFLTSHPLGRVAMVCLAPVKCVVTILQRPTAPLSHDSYLWRCVLSDFRPSIK